VILAAGGSRRFGRAKLLVRQGPLTLFERSVRLGQAVAGPRCVVVLGARASRHAAVLRTPRPAMVVNRRWRAGMSTSLAAGLKALPASARGALVLLADQYALQAADLSGLVAAWRRRPHAVVASGWAGLCGPPVMLPRAQFKAAMAGTGDAGARHLLRTPGVHVHVEPLAAAALDLDRPRDRAPARFRRHSPAAAS
jgi:molybdenum cofactor cytidylyltransferase